MKPEFAVSVPQTKRVFFRVYLCLAALVVAFALLINLGISQLIVQRLEDPSVHWSHWSNDLLTWLSWSPILITVLIVSFSKKFFVTRPDTRVFKTAFIGGTILVMVLSFLVASNLYQLAGFPLDSYELPCIEPYDSPFWYGWTTLLVCVCLEITFLELFRLWLKRNPDSVRATP